MQNLRHNPIGIYEKALPANMSWCERFKLAKSAGFDFIELSVDESDERLARLDYSDAEIDELISVMKKEKIGFRSMCLSGHRRFPFGSHDANTRAIAKDIMEKAIILAKKLGIYNIQLAGYDVYYEESDNQTLAYFYEGLRYAVDLAEKHSIMLTIEIMDTPFMGTIDRVVRYIDRIDSPWLKAYPDIGNLTQFSDNPSAELRHHKKHLVAIHLKDTKPGVFKKVAFGDGTVEFDQIFNTLSDMDYRGPFLVEMWHDDSVADPKIFIEDAKNWLYERM